MFEFILQGMIMLSDLDGRHITNIPVSSPEHSFNSCIINGISLAHTEYKDQVASGHLECVVRKNGTIIDTYVIADDPVSPQNSDGVVSIETYTVAANRILDKMGLK